jgi:hypothetical protein
MDRLSEFQLLDGQRVTLVMEDREVDGTAHVVYEGFDSYLVIKLGYGVTVFLSREFEGKIVGTRINIVTRI